jgi:hypothetical protein
MTAVPHVPALRAGTEYESLEATEVRGIKDGRVLARVSQVNAGIVRRDLRRIGERAAALRQVPHARMLEICKAAGELFLRGTVPLAENGPTQTPDQYVETLCTTSGLPHALCRRNMQKVFTVLDGMPKILHGLTRGLDPAVLDAGVGTQDGLPLCYGPVTDALGVVLPSNSPGVNSIWLPAVALRVPVVLKPGREEPWTPLRIMRSFLHAGCPREAFSFYPTDHEGSGAILELCGRSLLFGDEGTTKAWAGSTKVQIHGPGRSKVVLGADTVGDWRRYLDVLVASVADNGGRSCINASSIVVPSHGDEIADALARELARIVPQDPAADGARLSAFANPKFAELIDGMIERGLATPGAEDVTARHRDGPRLCERDGARYLLPTVVRCDSLEHPLGNTEFLFPFASVVVVPHAELAGKIGPSLVVTAITRDRDLVDALVRSPDVGRLNHGPVPTSHVEWDQPHEGNLFEFLFARRAFQRADGW